MTHARKNLGTPEVSKQPSLGIGIFLADTFEGAEGFAKECCLVELLAFGQQGARLFLALEVRAMRGE
jgi:hypothetical protein